MHPAPKAPSPRILHGNTPLHEHRMDTERIFTVTCARLLARELQLDGNAVLPLLAGTALLPAQLFRLNEYLSLPDYVTIIRNALRLSSNPALGLQLGSHLPAVTPGEIWRHHQNMAGPLVEMTLEQEAAGSRLVFSLRRPHDDIGIFLMEMLIVAAQNTLTSLPDHVIHHGHIELAYPPPVHAALYAEYLQVPYRFNAPRTLFIMPGTPASTATLSSFAASSTATSPADQHAAHTGTTNPHHGFAARTTDMLRNNPGQLWTLNDIAAALHVSSRTLMRRLKNDNTRYQQLLDAEQQHLARIHLDNPRHTVESVAAVLGYHDVSTFRRAFKRWFGIPPSEHGHMPNTKNGRNNP